ncbi:hypothetical protein HN51_007167 [Arachis hypogaea]|uniref:Protein kinase domain-containing protein n=1 Tax=Arachis hypogaea TaxID=3818 RepID=A0A445D974_ARAHY|nr:LEAF RUST 10 DISEASE-RESISTANCE LOCUS RECEPTOR-LIKE PROTEIN KINASE-like 1.5 [Arachis hypogaea]QHO41232.1 uncharacterized protein DS421_5g144000 [Arachis hypogaea]RYR59719.1 hypothetical protein Ahy_A05g025660 isoform A [Arachis hypogaea]
MNPHLHVSSISVFYLFFFFSFFCTPSTSHMACSSTKTPCPPFASTLPLPFPFSSSPGCGHPSFQLRCSTPHSFISINNLTFSILTYKPNTSSIILSPHNNDTSCPSTHFLSIPNQPINLSASPFRVLDASCARLFFLHPCSPPTNCNRCSWQCNLIKNPNLLLPDCGSMHRSASDSEPTCQTDPLGYLDKMLSFSGIELQWDQAQDPYFTSCKQCRGFCGFNTSDPNKNFICFHSESTISPPWIPKGKFIKANRTAVLTLAVALTTLLIVVSIVAFIKRNAGAWKQPFSEEDPTAVFLRNNRSLLPPVFTYEELESSTNGFDPKRKIGDGGFGSVYLGQLRDGRFVAVKHLHQHHNAAAGKAFSSKSFCNEILILSSINHPNLVKLHGYCSDPKGLLLVYDYVPNGTLADHLHGRNNRKLHLKWQVRLEMALQIAMAMEYLHFAVMPPVVHRDITTSNIFVEKDMRVKVGDFGLSRLLVLQDKTASSAGSTTTTGNNGCVWTGPQGTPGYLDPDYHRSFRLTEKSDVYSFGVVLLELISGLRAVDAKRDKREMALADMVVSRIQMGQLDEVVDPVLAADKKAVGDAVAAVAELAFRCVAAEKDDRPDSKEVVQELRRVRGRADVARE